MVECDAPEPHSATDPHLDAICRMAVAMFNVRHAFVSVLDETQQRFVGCAGARLQNVRRDISFCRFSLRNAAGQPLIVLNAAVDDRFRTNPFVTKSPRLRFYAGIPIALDDGINVATLCITDPEPRARFEADEVQRLIDLASSVALQLKFRRELILRQRTETVVERQHAKSLEADQVYDLAERATGFGRWSIDVASRTVVFSEGLTHLLGRPPMRAPTALETLVEIYHPEDRVSAQHNLFKLLRDVADGLSPVFKRRHRLIRSDGAVRETIVQGFVTYDLAKRPMSIAGVIVDVTDLVHSERQRGDTEAMLRTTLESMDQGLVNIAPDGRIRLWNRCFAETFELGESLSADGVTFDDLRKILVARGEYDGTPAPLRTALERGAVHDTPSTYERTRPDGRILEFRSSVLPDGGLVYTFSDVTERRRAERALQVSEHRFRLLAENANDVVILSDLDKTRRYVSPALQVVLGYLAESWIGTKPNETVHPDDFEQFNADLQRVARREVDHCYTCARYRHRDGRWVWIEVSSRVVLDPSNGRPLSFVSTLRDISERKQAEDTMRRMALQDDLTGLPNRIVFNERLKNLIGRAGSGNLSFALMICDVDRFKAFNDAFGHPAGDQLLRAIGKRGRSVLRSCDTFARLGGDEFAVILDTTEDEASAIRVADLLINAVGETLDLDGHEVEIGISIGVVVATGSEVQADELFRRADTALYLAKASGRSSCRLYDAATHEAHSRRSHLALDMRDALRHGEFRLVYQPVVDLKTGSVTSFEALMRWRHPRRGEISPAEFIPIAEETGLIVPIGEWALHEACREARRWPADIRVAVNVSTVQLRRDRIEVSVLQALASSGLPANRLKLEITESVLMGDAEPVLACLHRLKALGVRFALDDFGTGYSSLSYLRQFPFDRIKVDRAFIREIDHADTAAIVRAIVAIGDRLGMGITAEGVETPDQLERVREEGCQEVQGYLFSRPLPADEALEYAQRGLVKAA